jgi:hypothetical protein
MKLSDNLLRHIQEQAEKIPYGKITIYLNETCKEISVNIESQEKHPKENKALFCKEKNKLHSG